MTLPRASETVVVGAGVSGILVARELVRAGREVLLIERGGHKPHDAQLSDDVHEAGVATAEHNHEADPATPYKWDYLYGVGGTSLHWGGVTPRFLPSDFELRSRFGVGLDWPIGYDELEPFYTRAEQALNVAGGREAPYPRESAPELPPHPYAPVDQIVAPHLAPYYPLPQARPTESIGGRPPCCASGRCTLCPVDARYSALHTLDDAGLWKAPGFKLQAETVAARLVLRNRRVRAVECVDARGDRRVVDTAMVVLAASGFENPAILLRSGLEGEHLGRWLGDHRHRMLRFELDRSAAAGRGKTISTGVSYAFADHDSRDRWGSTIVYPENRGAFMVPALEDAIVAGRRGRRVRRSLRAQFERTLLLDTLSEDLPDRDRTVELSTSRDRFGLPLNRIRFAGESPYAREAHRRVERQLERRLRPLGAKLVGAHRFGGAHLLGTCRMGEAAGGVVDAQQRHHEIDNLYVTGGSSFPTYSCVQPTLTIAALALRLGAHLAEDP